MPSKAKSREEAEIDIFQSDLVPKHELLNAEEKDEILKRLSIKPKQLPRIKRDDAALRTLGAKKGDIIRVRRKSPVASEYYYYRVVA